MINCHHQLYFIHVRGLYRDLMDWNGYLGLQLTNLSHRGYSPYWEFRKVASQGPKTLWRYKNDNVPLSSSPWYKSFNFHTKYNLFFQHFSQLFKMLVYPKYDHWETELFQNTFEIYSISCYHKKLASPSLQTKNFLKRSHCKRKQLFSTFSVVDCQKETTAF